MEINDIGYFFFFGGLFRMCFFKWVFVFVVNNFEILFDLFVLNMIKKFFDSLFDLINFLII